MTNKQDNSYFDLPEEKKREIVQKAAEDSNKAQRELMDQPEVKECQFYSSGKCDNADCPIPHLPSDPTREEEDWQDIFKDWMCDMIDDKGVINSPLTMNYIMGGIEQVLKAHDSSLLQEIEGMKMDFRPHGLYQQGEESGYNQALEDITRLLEK